MPRPQLSFEEEFGLNQDQVVELLAHKLLDSWGVPSTGKTLYGRLLDLEDHFPNGVKALVDDLQAAQGKRLFWWYDVRAKNAREAKPVQAESKPSPYHHGPFDGWQDAINFYSYKQELADRKRKQTILQSLEDYK